MSTRWSPPLDAAAFLSAIADSCEDAVVVLDRTGTITAWNLAAERLYGHPAPAAVGRPATLLFPAGIADEAGQLVRQTVGGELVHRHDVVQVSRDGRLLHVSLTGRPARSASGDVIGAVLIARDLTATLRADHAVRSGEARWRAIIDAAVDGIVTIDRRGRIQSFNQAAERLFGYSVAEVIGHNVTMLMPPPYDAEHDAYINRYLATGEKRIIGIGREVSARRKDGSTFPVYLSVGEVSIDGEITFVGIVRDLSERVALELRLREESGLARLGELAAVLAHEVKNPLAAVSGAVQMIAHRFEPGTEEREISNEILRRLDALSALMGDLLLYARPPQPNLRPIELTDLVNSLIAFFRSDPEWRDIEVVMEGREVIVTADPELLKIAVQNLLLNAVQAMRGTGRLRVAVDVADGVACLDVADSGTGIPETIRDRVFTPFFTTKARGTGLGLATVRRIVESHGGAIRVLKSSPHGTTMRIQLPHDAADETQA
jgi:PAS domain S-box-containing protein